MNESKHTPKPWEYVPSNENHGPYVVRLFGGDIADCYTMSNLNDRAVCNGGTSRPIHYMGGMADANARLIAAAPDLLEAILNSDDAHWTPAMRAAITKATGADVLRNQAEERATDHALDVVERDFP
jgi:hypothetical protein